MTLKPLLEDWQLSCQYLTSPNSYIDMTFYYMIGAALQRRVWLGSSRMPIFANQYTILVGDPGLGKGIVIKPAIKMMTHHKAKKSIASVVPEGMQDNAQLIQKYIDELKISKNRTTNRSYLDEDPLLFPMAAESTTLRALTNANAKARRLFKPSVEMRKYALVPSHGIYSHASLCFLLEELSTLFKKHTEDTLNFMLVGWDCGDYKHATQHEGVDIIRNTCLSMLAGTTPGFMRDTFNDKLIDEGFSARTVFVFEERNRFDLYGIPDHTQEMIEAEARIITRLKELSDLFGQCSLTEDAMKFMKEYFEKVLPHERANNNPKLQPYYSKKNMHTSKLAMVIHFADSNEMVIQKSSCEKALEILAKLEIKMHYALSGGAKTQQGIATRKIIKFAENNIGKMYSIYELWQMLEGDIRDVEVREILQYLVATDQLTEEKIDGKQKYGKQKPKNSGPSKPEILEQI